MRMAPETVQRAYWEALCDMIQTCTFPTQWKEWIAMLAMKPGEDPAQLGRRRDLWITCGGQKIVMLMLQGEYKRVADAVVPSSQAGYGRDRNASEQTLVVRLAQEQAARRRTPIYIGFQDWNCYFMSVVRSTQWEVERRLGVDVAVTRVVRALHDEVRGRYETHHGLTNGFGINTGLGQGCVNAAERSKLPLVLIQRTIVRLVKGFKFDGYDEQGGVPECWFCDDAAFMTDSPHMLQLAYETSWLIGKVCGLKLMIKENKKKSAFIATYWDSAGRQRDVLGPDGGDWPIILPDGRRVPQIRQVTPVARASRGVRAKASAVVDKRAKPDDVHEYKYLGTWITPQWRSGMELTREQVRTDCIQAIKLAGRLPRLSSEQLADVINTVIGVCDWV